MIYDSQYDSFTCQGAQFVHGLGEQWHLWVDGEATTCGYKIPKNQDSIQTQPALKKRYLCPICRLRCIAIILTGLGDEQA